MKLVFEKIYCFYCPQFPYRGKVGISGNVEARRAGIEQEIRYRHGEHCRVRCLLKVPILTSAYAFEQALHNGFDRLYFPSKTMRGTNGGTEWWWAFNYVCAILTYFWGYAHGWQGECSAALALFVMFFFAPLDLILCVLLIAAAEYATAAGVAYLIFQLLT